MIVFALFLVIIILGSLAILVICALLSTQDQLRMREQQLARYAGADERVFEFGETEKEEKP